MRLCAAYFHCHCSFIVFVYMEQMKLLSNDNRRLDFRTRPKTIAHINNSHRLNAPIYGHVFMYGSNIADRNKFMLTIFLFDSFN